MIEIMDAAVIRGDWVGHVVDDKFPLLQWLGGNGASGVFATELRDSAKAIVKLVPADSAEAESRMRAWAAAGSLKHPNLMQVYTYGRCEIDDMPLVYVVTESADEVLAEILKERPLTTHETMELLVPSLDALAYLHARGFVHSRLKPANIMACGDQLKLSADGLVFMGARGRTFLEPSVYDAPEAAQGPLEAAADVWSLGVTLVEMLTQQAPHWEGTITSEPAVPESVPQPFAGVARSCLRTDPTKRCSIDEIKVELGVTKARREALLVETKTPTPSHRRAAVMLALAGVLLAALAIWRVVDRGPARQDEQATAPQPAATPLPAPAPAPKPAKQAAQKTAPTAAPEQKAPSAPAVQAPAPPPASAQAPVATAPPPPAPAPPSVTARHSSSGALVKGAVAQQVQPDVAEKALKTVTGHLRVAVSVTVDESGNVTDANLDTAGPSQYFANKSLSAAQHWKFTPPQVNGQAAASTWILHFEFTHDGVNATAEETAP